LATMWRFFLNPAPGQMIVAIICVLLSVQCLYHNSFLILAICFVLFYLPLRYLFLVEDHSSRQTWQRFFLIFGFLAIRFLFIFLDL